MRYCYTEAGVAVVNVDITIEDLRALLDITAAAAAANDGPVSSYRVRELHRALLHVAEGAADRIASAAANLSDDVRQYREGAEA
jgi:hypothetical protein